MTDPWDLTCQQLVELVTAYLDDALEPEARATFEAHLAACAWCITYLEQIRESVRLTHTLSEDAIDPEVLDRLMLAFSARRP